MEKPAPKPQPKGFIPPGLSPEMAVVLENAREIIRQRKEASKLDDQVKETLKGYDDDDELEEVEDQIEQEAFDELLKEFITEHSGNN